jgi:hypothetical protein
MDLKTSDKPTATVISHLTLKGAVSVPLWNVGFHPKDYTVSQSTVVKISNRKRTSKSFLWLSHLHS